MLDRLHPWRTTYPEVPVRAYFAAASAKDLLLDLSKEASLVVVGGSRGHGRLVIDRQVDPPARFPAPCGRSHRSGEPAAGRAPTVGVRCLF